MTRLIKIKNLSLIVLLSPGLCYCCKRVSGNLLSDEIRELNRESIELESNLPENINDEVLDMVFPEEGIRLYGLGEAAHGSSTLLKLKAGLFKFLVENRDCRALLYEFNFRESLKLNRYVTLGEGNLDSLIYDLYWIQANNEFRDLLEWIKDYNSGVSKDKIVQFLGIDCQLDMFKPDELRTEFEKQNPRLADYASASLNKLASLGKPVYKGMGREEYRNIEDEISELRKACTSFYEISSSYSSMKQSIIFHLVDCMMLSHEFLYSAYNGGHINRDRFMADNTIGLKESLFPGASVMALWAHNSHLAINSDMYQDKGPSMGYYLRETLGESYLVCGTSFNMGKVTAVEEDPITGKDTPPHSIVIDTVAPEGSVNNLFGLCRYENFILPINRLEMSSRLYNYLDTLRPFLGIGDCYRGTYILHYSEDRTADLVRSYDIIFHINKIKPITPTGKWAF